jgi:ATP-binding cassette subfamily C protein LapB
MSGPVSPAIGALFAQLKLQPALALQLVAASLILNLLGLASALYVIQVFNRYVSYGITATLVTLTGGVLLAIAGEHAFRRLRHHLAEDLLGDAAERWSVGLFGLLVTARVAALDARPAAEREEILRGVERAELALGPATLTAVADIPFSLLFLLVLALLSPALAGIAAGFCAAAIAWAWLGQRRLAAPIARLRDSAERSHALVTLTALAADTIRQFRAGAGLVVRWQQAVAQRRAVQRTIAGLQHDGLSGAQAIQGLMGVAVIGIGAVLVVDGTLDLGALIGANLIAARALAPLMRLVQMTETLDSARQHLERASTFATIAVEPAGRKTVPGWHGRLEVCELGFRHAEAAPPLFSALSFALAPGGVLVITGRNGTGKSTLLRLLAGLIEPGHGRVLVDGVALDQLALDWWRGQVAYVPQEPSFIDGTLRETLLAARPDASPAALAGCLDRVGLAPLIERHPLGLDQPLSQGGLTLAPGLRRRLALARALLVDGPLFLLDEPSEGLDRDGAGMVYALLIDLVRRGKTLIVVSHDPTILGGARLLLRFDGREPQLSHGPDPAA